MMDMIKMLAIMLKIIHFENMWLMKSMICKDKWKNIDETYEKNFNEYFEKLMNYGNYENNEVDDGK